MEYKGCLEMIIFSARSSVPYPDWRAMGQVRLTRSDIAISPGFWPSRSSTIIYRPLVGNTCSRRSQVSLPPYVAKPLLLLNSLLPSFCFSLLLRIPTPCQISHPPRLSCTVKLSLVTWQYICRLFSARNISELGKNEQGTPNIHCGFMVLTLVKS